MVWSQFSIKIFGVHFGNSVLDNSNWDKISHSLTKKLHMWGRWGIPQNFLLAFIDGFWKTRKMRLLKKWKKLLEKTSFYTSVPKIIIICYTVPEIWCVRGVIVIFHFGLFFAFLPTTPPPNSPKNDNFKTMEKTAGDVILHKWTKNHDHMLYCSWDIVRDGGNCYF